MRNIGDIVEATKEMTFYVPAFHVVKVGDKGEVVNTHPDVKTSRADQTGVYSAPNLVRFTGAPGAQWVSDEETNHVSSR